MHHRSKLSLFSKAWRIRSSGKICTLLVAVGAQATCAEWVRPSAADQPLTWGLKNGSVFGVPSQGGMGGPRGLIRIGIWNAAKNQAELINFVAIEPVVAGNEPRQSRMAYSELEKGSDGKQGKIFTIKDAAGKLEKLSDGAAEQLSVRIEVEPFTANKTHVYVIASMRSDRPEEVRMSVHHLDGSASIDELTLTATMGNYERLRLLWLKDRVLESRQLYPNYTDSKFAEEKNYPLADIIRTSNGDAIALATTDESDPAAAAVTERPFWTYKSVKLTQFWKVPAADIQPDLRVKVNARFTYWTTQIPLPNGIAFENFEMRQKYIPGQSFIFGLTPAEPAAIRPAIPNLGRK